MEINFVFWKTSLFSKTFLSTRDVRRFLIFAFSIQICYFPWERCSLNLKGKPLMNDISYSTPKVTPLIISLLQPISNLSGIGISTVPNYWGPTIGGIRAPKQLKWFFWPLEIRYSEISQYLQHNFFVQGFFDWKCIIKNVSFSQMWPSRQTT